MTRFSIDTDLSARRSVVCDTLSGIAESAVFYESSDSFQSGVTTVGPQEPTAAVLLCNLLYAEGLRNFRRETIVARALAAVGIASHRFDYRGTGNSAGETSEITLDSLADDIATAADHLAEMVGSLPLGVVATRLATIPVARAVGRLNPRALVLWQPVVDYGQFFKRLERNKGIQDRAEALRAEKFGFDVEPRPPIREQLEQAGVADVTGFSYGRPMHDSFGGDSVHGDLATFDGHVRVIQISQREVPQKPLQAFTDTLGARGVDADLHVVAGEEENWWFRTGVQEFYTEEDRAVNAAAQKLTTEFMTMHLAGGA